MNLKDLRSEFGSAAFLLNTMGELFRALQLLDASAPVFLDL